MESFLVPFRRMKWGFLPQRRIVDEGENDGDLDLSASTTSGGGIDDKGNEITNSKSKTNIDNHSCESSANLLDTTVYEYRDEANRPFWKFFDEHEYRSNNQVRTKKKWYHWFHDADTPEERRLILKLDLLLTFYSLMAYWVKYLDQTNLTNAYIGGLKEAIGMKGNDFVNTQVMFNVGNIIFQIPFIYILYACPMNYVLPSLDITWSILTILLSQVKNVAQLKALRFLIGAAEAPAYLAYHFLFASWYKSSTSEIARRAGFYYLGQYLGVLTSGLLSGAIQRSFTTDGWKWIFIIDGIISIVVGIIGFYMIPGTPTDCYSPFLSDDDIRLARKRMKDDGKDTRDKSVSPIKEFMDINLWKSIFSTWHIYVMCIWTMLCWNNSNAASGAYALWLKSLKNDYGEQRFSQGTLQDLTALTPGLGLVWLVMTSLFADNLSSRWGAILFSQVFNVTGNILLAVWHIPERAKWFAFCLQYWGWAMAPVLYSWHGDIMRRRLKNLTVSLITMNIMAQSSVAWIAVLVWKTVEAPRFLKGYSFTASSGFALTIWTMLVLYLYKREERMYAKENGIILYNSKNDPDFVPPTSESTIKDKITIDDEISIK